jgi:hypothetical protein
MHDGAKAFAATPEVTPKLPLSHPPVITQGK